MCFQSIQTLFELDFLKLLFDFLLKLIGSNWVYFQKLVLIIIDIYSDGNAAKLS